MATKDLVIGSSLLVTYNIKDQDGREFGHFSFSPSDTDIVKRHKKVVSELEKIGIIDSKNVKDYHVERIEKAYPSYFDTYDEIDKLISYIDEYDKLYCVGRNGQHRYNNMDHSIITSFEAVDNIINGIKDKSNIWNVNTEKEYHESK